MLEQIVLDAHAEGSKGLETPKGKPTVAERGPVPKLLSTIEAEPKQRNSPNISMNLIVTEERGFQMNLHERNPFGETCQDIQDPWQDMDLLSFSGSQQATDFNLSDLDLEMLNKYCTMETGNQLATLTTATTTSRSNLDKLPSSREPSQQARTIDHVSAGLQRRSMGKEVNRCRPKNHRSVRESREVRATPSCTCNTILRMVANWRYWIV